jgi:hypothetical protein
MLKTQRFIIACLVLAAGLGMGYVLAVSMTSSLSPDPAPLTMFPTNSKQYELLKTVLIEDLQSKGVVTDGLSPYLLLEHYPALVSEDFEGVEAVVGRYTMTDGVLSYESGETVLEAATGDLSSVGFSQFLKNYSDRIATNLTELSVEEILSAFHASDTNNSAGTAKEYVACTMDAKVCPDGSYVGRVGPTCEFAACPSLTTTPKAVACTKEQKESDVCLEIYQPVCATVQIQCLTTPCEPIPKTFGNSCEACQEASVTEYTEGACGTVGTSGILPR